MTETRVAVDGKTYIVSRSDPSTSPEFNPLTHYLVFDEDNKPVGSVSKIETTSYRKVGRLIARTFKPIRWVANRHGARGIDRRDDRRVGWEHYTRAEAVEALARDYIDRSST